ncbi:ABC transporter substrate-binding protein [Nocardia sp. NPDC056000]|uniref:ABC transporter substrate-binding protein n=1 Tax=Nocardia sp. NPDC056000 TaxID=3345674 RepID=UPI0035D86CF0
MRARRTPGTSARLTGIVAALGIAVAASLTACSSDTPAPTAFDGPIGAVNLREVCPATVVVQSGWNPEAEFGFLYNLISAHPSIDAGRKATTGPLFAHGEYTGVNLEIRAGGPAIGFQPVMSRMYQDHDITLGFVDTEQAVFASATAPVTSVFAPMTKSPQMIMWDPQTYPGVKTIADLKAAKAKVLYFQGEAYMNYLVGAGVLDKSQTDSSYDGTPSYFVAANGKSAQQGFASTEPYVYEHQVQAWNKPVAYQLIADAGFPTYKSTMAVRSGELAQSSACLKKLVPVLQRSVIDYLAAPDAANKVIVDSVAAYNTGWTYDADNARYAVRTMLADGIVGNGTTGALGGFDLARVGRILEVTKPIFTADGVALAPDLTPDRLATNEFIDPAIGLSGS